MSLLREATKVLRATGLEYEIRDGKRHHIVVLAGQTVAVLPRGKSYDGTRGWLNFTASVRRRTKEVLK